MFRGSRMLSCTIRPFLLRVRDPHPNAVPGHTCTRAQKTLQFSQNWRGINSNGGRREDFLSFLKATVTSFLPLSLDCKRYPPQAAALPNLLAKATLPPDPQLPQDSTQSKLAFQPQQCGSISNAAHTPKHTNTYYDCSHNAECLQPQRRPSACWSSLLHLVQFGGRPTRRLSTPQTRALHQAAAREAPALRGCLSPENEQRCRCSLGPNLRLYEGDKLGRLVGKAKGNSQGRWASVLVSLCTVEGEPAVLFTLRSSMLKGRHKGDVSFPGGKCDPSDTGVVATALREAGEELGITVTQENVWGVMKPLRDGSGMLIAPVLANLGPLEELSFKPNPGEVEEIFTLSLSHLCDPVNRAYTCFRTGEKYGYTLPVFRNGKHRVWGLTAVALTHTLQLIVSP